MALVNDPNYTTPQQATYHSDDADIYSRSASYTLFLQDLSVHDHRTGKGLGAGRITSTAIAATANTGEVQVISGGMKITDGTSVNTLTDVVNNGATTFKCIGLTGATAASRYVGATTSGAPLSGTFAVGDYIIDQSGYIYVCTVAGSPGTWVRTDHGLTITSPTVDGVLFYTSANTVGTTGAGTSGQVMTSNGAGVAPTYQAAPSTSLTTVLQFQNAADVGKKFQRVSSANISINTSIGAIYFGTSGSVSWPATFGGTVVGQSCVNPAAANTSFGSDIQAISTTAVTGEVFSAVNATSSQLEFWGIG